MRLFEWLGESYDPGPSGSVRLGGGGRAKRSRAAVLIRFVVSIVSLVVLYVLVFELYVLVFERTGLPIPVALGIIVVYLLLGYYVHPTRIHYLGPDLNGFLLFLKVVLLPGRFVAESLVDFCVLVRSVWQRPPSPPPP